MDASFFGLRHRPFPVTPDTSCYYPATCHEQALARLLRGLQDGEGVLVLTGTAGTGKTLLCHCLLERLGPDTSSVFLTNSHIRDRAGLLQALLYDLSLPYEGRGEQEMRLGLTEHLLRTFAEGRSTLLLIDEAHHLTPDLLEELRLLGNLEGRSGKAVQVILAGQPDLLNTLRRPELLALGQRLAVRAELEPLNIPEAADYLLHHLRVAGGRPEEVLAVEAVEPLARAAGGIPRLLNQAAHQAFRLAWEAQATQVDVEAALEALAVLGLDVPEEPSAAESGEETVLPLLSLEDPAEPIRLETEGPAGRFFAAPPQPA
jgi:type II secretory pathway predicted ATPase ExeA